MAQNVHSLMQQRTQGSVLMGQQLPQKLRRALREPAGVALRIHICPAAQTGSAVYHKQEILLCPNGVLVGMQPRPRQGIDRLENTRHLLYFSRKYYIPFPIAK